MEAKLFFEFLGKRIKEKREEKGLTINELSIKCGIRKIYLRKIEAGEAYGLSTTKFLMIADALDTLPSNLVKNWEEFYKTRKNGLSLSC